MSSRSMFDNSETDLKRARQQVLITLRKINEYHILYDPQIIRTREKISEFTVTLPWNKQQISEQTLKY